jgi:hypothetical protein
MIRRHVATVFDYVSDFGNFTQWATDVIEAQLITDGPIGIGTQARVVRQALGQSFEMRFDLVRYEPNRQIGFTGLMLGTPFRSGLDFESFDHSTKVTQSGEVNFTIAVLLFEPIIREVLGTTFESDLRNLKRLLETKEASLL